MAYVTTYVDRRILVVQTDSPPVNALSLSVRSGLSAAINYAARHSDIDAIVLHCLGRTFFAGADINEFGKPTQLPDLQTVVDQIEDCPKPVVAAIHGTALGGGLEIALAAHSRVAASSARLGLPEVKLGILPGAGGTQRLPRLIALERALDMIALGEPVDTRQAVQMGLVDRLTDETDLLGDAILRARELAQAGCWPVTSCQPVRLAQHCDVGLLFQRFRAKNARTIRNLEAAEACVQAVEAAARLPFNEGRAVERSLFTQLISSEQSKALRHIFFAERNASKIEMVPRPSELPTISRIGIVGAGTMGRGIAIALLQAGIPVHLVERDAAALERGAVAIRQTLDAAAAKGRISPLDANRAQALFSSSLAFEDLAEHDLVIEAVFEDMAVKRDVLRTLEAVTKPTAILASNTSYLDLDEMATVVSHPERVIGLHFFSPANIMKLVEVVGGRATSPEILHASVQLVRKIGKIPVAAGVCDGFIGNRMLKVRQREAEKLVLEGILPWDVDRVLTDFGFPMGPFQMADLAGLDLGWTREKSTGSTLKEILCESDRRGQKNGRGFYDYDNRRAGTPSRDVELLVRDFARRSGTAPSELSDQEILERLIFPMINEAAMIIDEGIAQRPSDIDVVWVFGYGWPKWTGGPIFWANALGLEKISAGLSLQARRAGSDAQISPLLGRDSGSFRL